MKVFAAASLFIFFSPAIAKECISTEKFRVIIENKKDGLIRGSRSKGKTWQTIGQIKVPISGGTWRPSEVNGVLAYDFLRGPSNIFASAMNNLHIRFSDPEGYTLPDDKNIPPIPARGATFAPVEAFTSANVPNYIGLTNIHGGTGIFNYNWAPRVGDKVYVDFGNGFEKIPYNFSINKNMTLMYVSGTSNCEIESIEYENRVDGLVYLKRQGESAVAVAKVTKPVEGVGRFIGSEYLRIPGTIRANHAGVFDIGTTDIGIDKNIPKGTPISELRGGFQVVPSFHFSDPSMMNGRDHAFVYLVVGPLNQKEKIIRYDMGIEGRYPLFNQGARAGTGKTYYKFRGDSFWYEQTEATKLGKFKNKHGDTLSHLRGIIPDALHDVTHIKIVFSSPEKE